MTRKLNKFKEDFMKKKTLKLGKKTIDVLDKNLTSKVKGGNQALEADAGFTGGCSDGCTPYVSRWNCSLTYCTRDCGN
jgi:hypothetical protein